MLLLASLSEAQSKVKVATITSDISEHENTNRKKRKMKRSNETGISNNSFKKLKEKPIEMDVPQYNSPIKSSSASEFGKFLYLLCINTYLNYPYTFYFFKLFKFFLDIIQRTYMVFSVLKFIINILCLNDIVIILDTILYTIVNSNI